MFYPSRLGLSASVSAWWRAIAVLLEAGVLNRLYLTHANRLLAGQPFSSIVEGELFKTAVDLQINSIYLDDDALDGLGQLYISYDLPGQLVVD